MALLNSTVLRSSRGGAPLLPMVAQPQPVALRSGSSNILMAGQNVAVHSCANGGSCACSGAGCRAAQTAASAVNTGVSTQIRYATATSQPILLRTGTPSTAPTALQRAFASTVGSLYDQRSQQVRNLAELLGKPWWFSRTEMLKQAASFPDVVQLIFTEAAHLPPTIPITWNLKQFRQAFPNCPESAHKIMAFVGLFLVPKPRETDEQLKLRMANVLAALLAKYCPIRNSPPAYDWPWLWGKKGAELVAIGIGCSGNCEKAQCGSVSVEYTYIDPVTKKKLKGTVTCPCAEKSCPDPLVCDQNKCDCPAGGVDIGKPCGDGSPGGCSCVGYSSSFSAVECYKGACFDSGPCGIDLAIQVALEKYLASGGTKEGANSQKWEVTYWSNLVNNKPWVQFLHPCGIGGVKSALIEKCTDAKAVQQTLVITSIVPEDKPC